MGIEGVVLSTSQMRLGIQEGTFSGWDDIRLGTLRALARRGIGPEAVKNAVLAIGIGDTDISFSWDNLYAENKKIVDPIANRYFFVPKPVTAQIEGAQPHAAHAMLHPGDPSRGNRSLAFQGTVLLPGSEINPDVTMIRLKDLFNVEISWDNGIPTFSYSGDSLAEARAAKAHIIQWLPAQDTLPCTLLTQEGEIAGACEPAVKQELGKVVQFERVGFVKIDSIGPDGVKAYFTHT
jgi:glutamyl-tRNA synthetase